MIKPTDHTTISNCIAGRTTLYDSNVAGLHIIPQINKRNNLIVAHKSTGQGQIVTAHRIDVRSHSMGTPGAKGPGSSNADSTADSLPCDLIQRSQQVLHAVPMAAKQTHLVLLCRVFTTKWTHIQIAASMQSLRGLVRSSVSVCSSTPGLAWGKTLCNFVIVDCDQHGVVFLEASHHPPPMSNFRFLKIQNTAKRPFRQRADGIVGSWNL
mmetsp:Transcript_43840/g.95499  ORF Transcript_43840/g.95499 Transcript_43840/m.95499 type:complete len:210 (-) Transcript_43840:697-1326(-)